MSRAAFPLGLEPNRGKLPLATSYPGVMGKRRTPGGVSWSFPLGTALPLTYDRSNLSVYVDGEDVLVAPPSEPYETDGAFPLMTGTNTENRDDEYFIGSIAQVRIYDGTLTQSEILDLF